MFLLPSFFSVIFYLCIHFRLQSNKLNFYKIFSFILSAFSFILLLLFCLFYQKNCDFYRYYLEVNWIRYKFSAATQICLDLKSRFTLFLKFSIPSANSFSLNFLVFILNYWSRGSTSIIPTGFLKASFKTVIITVSFDSKKHIFLYV